MTTTTSRPEEVDDHGMRHRYACEQPGYTTEPGHVRGFTFARCVGCGALALARAKADL